MGSKKDGTKELYKALRNINRLLRNLYILYYISKDGIIRGKSTLSCAQRVVMWKNELSVQEFNGLLINSVELFDMTKNLKMGDLETYSSSTEYKISSKGGSVSLTISYVEEQRIEEQFIKQCVEKISHTDISREIGRIESINGFTKLSDSDISILENGDLFEYINDDGSVYFRITRELFPLLSSKTICEFSFAPFRYSEGNKKFLLFKELYDEMVVYTVIAVLIPDFDKED